MVSNDLSDMFGVFEFECYYPAPLNLLNVFDLTQPFSLQAVFQLEELLAIENTNVLWKNFFRSIIAFLKTKITPNQNSSLQECIKLVTDIIDNLYGNYLKVVNTGLTKLEELLSILSPKITLKDLEDNFNHFINHADFKTLISDFKLKLDTHHYKFDSEMKFIGFIKALPENSFDLIKLSLHEEFKGSLFADDIIEVNISKDRDIKLNGAVWNITSDRSLTDHFLGYIPVEIVSRRISFSQMALAIQFMSSLFKRLGIKTSKNTGLHLNIGFNTTRNIDLLKVVVLTADDYELKLFGREDNNYCRSQIEYLVQTRVLSPTNEKAVSVLWEQVQNYNKENKFPIDREKYAAINFKKWLHPYESLKPVLEFRIMGGEGYLNDTAKLIHRMNRFFYIVSVAGNPELYKREYIHRLIRLQERSTDKDIEYWSIKELHNSLSNKTTKLISTITNWTTSEIILSKTFLDSFKDDILDICKDLKQIKKIDFNIFRKYISPLIKVINNNEQLKSFIKELKEVLNQEKSPLYRTFNLYFSIALK